MKIDLMLKCIYDAKDILAIMNDNQMITGVSDVVRNKERCRRLKYLLSVVEGQLLLKTHTGAIAEPPHCANSMLSEVSPEVDTSTIGDRRGGLGETPAVKQNEQTKEVCPYCKSEIESWFKSCPECREHIYR